MTSDQPLDPFLRQLEAFSDRVFRGDPATPCDLDPATRGAVRRLHGIDRIPPLDRTHMTQRKENLMSYTATWPIATEPLAPAAPTANGTSSIPIPMPRRDRHRKRLPMILPIVSAAVMLALIGGLIFGVINNRTSDPTDIPAVIPGSPSPESSPLGSDWGQFRGGVERTGYTNDPGPGGVLNLQWSFTADESLNGIVEADGKVYAYGAEGSLYAIDASSGEQVWAIDLIAGQFGDLGHVPLPAISDGVVYASTTTGVLVAIDADTGSVLWQKALSDQALSGPTVADGHIYVAIDGNHISSLTTESGREEWSWDVPGGVSTEYPTIADGKLFITDNETAVHAVDVQSGESIWSTEPIRGIRVSAYQDGMLFVPGDDGRLTALTAATGEIRWSTEPKGNEAMNPIVTPAAVIVAVASEDVEALDPQSGQVIWTLSTPELESSPHAGGDTVYVQFDLTTLTAVDLTSGTSLGTADDTGAGSTVAISGDLFIVSGRDGPIRAFGPVKQDPDVVTAIVPTFVALDEPGATAATVEPAAIEAPETVQLQADLLLTQTIDPDQFVAGFQKAPDGTLWMAYLDGRLLVFDRDGNLLESRHYDQGSGPKEFDWEIRLPRPGDLWWQGASFAWLPDGTVQVTDAGNARIQIMAEDGKLVGEWGSRGNEDGQFQTPVWIALTPNKELAVVDPGRRDIQWFDQNGDFLRKLTGPQAGEEFGRPVELEYDSNGDFWVLDVQYSRLHKFDASGHLLLTIGDFPTSDQGAFNTPVDIDIDETDRVWVADQENHRIQVFDNDGNLLAVWNGCESDAKCFMYLNWVIYGGNNFLFVYDFDLNAVNEQRLMKFHITSLLDVPIMAAATPAAAPMATPMASPTSG